MTPSGCSRTMRRPTSTSGRRCSRPASFYEARQAYDEALRRNPVMPGHTIAWASVPELGRGHGPASTCASGRLDAPIPGRAAETRGPLERTGRPGCGDRGVQGSAAAGPAQRPRAMQHCHRFFQRACWTTRSRNSRRPSGSTRRTRRRITIWARSCSCGGNPTRESPNYGKPSGWIRTMPGRTLIWASL